MSVLPPSKGPHELNVLKSDTGLDIAMLGLPGSVEWPGLELQNDPGALSETGAAGTKPDLLPGRCKSGESARARVPLIELLRSGCDATGLHEGLIGHVGDS